MAKTYRQRVKIAISEDGYPVYKWVTAHCIDDLNDGIVRAYIENGLISRMMEEAGLSGKVLEPTVERPLFQDYAAKWFETYKATSLKPTTCLGYRSNLNRHIYPFFGQKRINEITTDDVQDWLNGHESLAHSTMRTMFILLGEIMASAYEDHLIETNPTISKRLHIPSKGKKERSALTVDQLKQIIRQMWSKLDDPIDRLLLLR